MSEAVLPFHATRNAPADQHALHRTCSRSAPPRSPCSTAQTCRPACPVDASRGHARRGEKPRTCSASVPTGQPLPTGTPGRRCWFDRSMPRSSRSSRTFPIVASTKPTPSSGASGPAHTTPTPVHSVRKPGVPGPRYSTTRRPLARCPPTRSPALDPPILASQSAHQTTPPMGLVHPVNLVFPPSITYGGVPKTCLSRQVRPAGSGSIASDARVSGR